MSKKKPVIKPFERHGLSLGEFEHRVLEELKVRGLDVTVTRVKDLTYGVRPTRLIGSFEMVLVEKKKK